MQCLWPITSMPQERTPWCPKGRKNKKLVVAAREITAANVFADFARVDPSSVPSIADAADPPAAGASSELVEAESTGEPGARKGKLAHALRRVMMMGVVSDN